MPDSTGRITRFRFIMTITLSVAAQQHGDERSILHRVGGAGGIIDLELLVGVDVVGKGNDYNGTGLFPGHFKKSITVQTNGAVEMTRIYIEGEMKEEK